MQNPVADIAASVAPVSIRWETDHGFYRETRAPGTSLDDLPADVRDAIEAHWTPERVASWEAEQAALLDPGPPPPIPDLTPRQLRLMLLQLGMSEDQVVGSINLIEDAGLRAAALIEWNWATQYERNHPLVIQLSAALDFTPEELDSLWEYAADL